MERILCSGGLRHPSFRLVKAGAKLDLGSYTTSVPWRPAPFSGTAEVGRVLSEFEAGATLVLQGLLLSWPPLSEFCRNYAGAGGPHLGPRAVALDKKPVDGASAHWGRGLGRSIHHSSLLMRPA